MGALRLMKVPFLDLKAHHEPLRDEIAAAMTEVIDGNAFAGGPFVESFEHEFSTYCDTQAAVGVGSGTEALWLSLLALGVGSGDEVITVPNTFIATAEAISFTGARPVFVDVEAASYNLDPERLASAISPRTKAIIPVHLFGQTADMDPILTVAEEHGIPVVEDAAQAHGAAYRKRRAGSMGRVGCFSFYPGKNLGAWGEAGAVVTSDRDVAERVRQRRDHGQPKKYVHDVIGWNSRMDGLQAAVLSVKLRHLENANERRRDVAERYDDRLANVSGVICPALADHRVHVYHLYVVRVLNRDRILKAMANRGIACGIHYPIPLHFQEAYQWLGHEEGDFPVAEQCAREFISLPMYPELTAEQVDYVADTLREVVDHTKSPPTNHTNSHE